MFKKIKSLRTLKQRGQIFLIYALLVPMLFFFVGITFDLSWYYINISRMQNAADAAVIAGAQTLIGENGNLYCYVDKSFVRSYDSKKFAEYYQDTTLGDTVAKTYVKKNLARRSSDWDSDTIIDSWTRNELYFESTLLGDKADNFETLYYHIMLEEDVPHMFLNGWFDAMNAKVSSVVRISQYIKDYDFFEQMKYLGFKRNRLAMKDDALADKNEDKKNPRAVLIDKIETEDKNHRRIETFKLDGIDRDKNFYDYLFATLSGPNTTAQIGDNTGTNKRYKTHRIINISEVYPVRDYGFYYDYTILKKLRDTNSAYSDLDDRELASALAKDSSDPMFIVIERETDFARQLIINVNVSNINEFNDRPIILIYEGPEYDDSYPVILNLNADFRGILYAPNSPVVINGNENDFQGFVIAQSYVKLLTEQEDEYGDYTPIDDEHGNTLLVDDYGEVQYKEENGTYYAIELDSELSLKTNEGISFAIVAFNLNSSEFDSFNLVRVDNNITPSYSSGMINNLFIQPPENGNR